MVRDGVAIFGCGGSNVTPSTRRWSLAKIKIYATLMAGYEQVPRPSSAPDVCHRRRSRTRCDRIVGQRRRGHTARGVSSRRSRPRLHLGPLHRVGRRRRDRSDAGTRRRPLQGRRLYRRAERSARRSTRGWSFFEVPPLSRVGRSADVYYGKLVNRQEPVAQGWSLCAVSFLGRLSRPAHSRRASGRIAPECSRSIFRRGRDASSILASRPG